MATVKGKWVFNEVLTYAYFDEYVNFTSNEEPCIGFFIDDGAFSPSTCSLCYKTLDEGIDEGYNGFGVYFFEEADGIIGWEIFAEPYKTIDFGETEQEVSEEFYAWLVENATTNHVNTQINITESGTTTLATAGMYCDRDIDVNVDVPSYEAELAEQKAITDGILRRNITEYVNNTVTKLGTYALSYCGKMTKLRCSAVEEMENYCVRYCTSLIEARFDSVKTIKAQVFQNCNKMTKLILGSPSLCELTNVNAFNLTPIAEGTGYIYVPDNLVNEYKQATNWATYASQIKSINELEV